MITAITGGIGEGKSTVVGYLNELGYRTASADSFARDLFAEPGVNRQLAEVSGLPYPIAPHALRSKLLSDPEIRRSINRIMHPKVIEAIYSSNAQFVEIPLLIETCLFGRFDAIWVVTCGVDEQLRRLVDRYGSEIEAKHLMQTQLPTMAKIAFADEILRTNQAPEAVRRFVSQALARRFDTG